MGASAREIEREIRETRGRMDDNLTRLEDKAATGARRFGLIAVAVMGVAAVLVAGAIVYRRTHRPTLRDRLEGLSLADLRSVAGELTANLKERAPSVTVRVNEKTEAEPGTMQTIVGKVAPALLGTAGSALLNRLVAAPDDEQFAAAQAE